MNKSLPSSLSNLNDKKKLFDDNDSTDEDSDEIIKGFLRKRSDSAGVKTSLLKSDSCEKIFKPRTLSDFQAKKETKAGDAPKVKEVGEVSHHPLEGSRRSSLSDDDEEIFTTSTPSKIISSPIAANVAPSPSGGRGRMNRLHNFITTNLDESYGESQSVVSAASTLWNHRSKVFDTLRKQVVSHGAWNFANAAAAASPSSSSSSPQQQLSSSPNSRGEKELVAMETATTVKAASRSMPSISRYSDDTDGVDEDHDDDAELAAPPSSPTVPAAEVSSEHLASSFLNDLRTRVPSVFAKKQQQQQAKDSPSAEQHEALSAVGVMFGRDFGGPATTTTASNHHNHQSPQPTADETTSSTTASSSISKTNKNYNMKNSFAVSLSSLLNKKKEERREGKEDDEDEDGDTKVEEEAKSVEEDKDEKVVTCQPTSTNPHHSPNPSHPTTNHEEVDDRGWQVEGWQLLVMTTLVMLYLTSPLPHYVVIACRAYFCGVGTCVLLLLLFATPPSGGGSVTSKTTSKSFMVNRSSPEPVPAGLTDLTQPFKGWMNEISNYDIETYHVGNTTSVYVTIHQNTLRIQTPLKNISRRCTYNEGKIPLTQVLTQRLFKLENAEVYLEPEELVSKRIWSKKYPICVRVQPTTNNIKHKAKQRRNSASSGGCVETSEGETTNTTVLYLFGRSCRQKEEWFYKIQQAINLCRCSAASGGETSKEQGSASTTTAATASSSAPTSGSEWMILDDNDDPVQTCLHEMETINLKPHKLLDDYHLQMTRLLPDVSNRINPTPPPPPSDKEDAAASSGGAESQPVDRRLDRIKKRFRASSVPVQVGETLPPPSPQVSSYQELERQLRRVKVDKKRDEEEQVSWINVLVGRVMFDFLRQPQWTNRLFARVQKKLDKIHLPYFVESLKLIEMNLGSSAPLVHQISLPRIDHQGIWVEAEVTYDGSFQMSLETYVLLTKLGKGNGGGGGEKDQEDNKEGDHQHQDKHRASGSSSSSKMSAIVHSEAEDSAESSDDGESNDINHQQADSSSPSSQPSSTSSSNSSHQPKKWMRVLEHFTKSKYFKKATEYEYIKKKLESISHTPVLLTVELLQMRGVVTINIPPPPTDRIWYGFREPPDIELKAYPKVGERLISLQRFADAIQEKLKQEFVKLLVLPNMEDLQIPLLFSNRNHR